MTAQTSDYEWLVSGAADEWLRMAVDGEVTPAAVAHLRRSMSAERAGLIATQWTLRRKARRKFSRAEELYWDPLALEQATDEWIADYKASTLAPATRVADLCCGIGGDAMSLVRVATVTAVDRDPIRALLAQANLRHITGAAVEVHAAEVANVPLVEFDGWHIDPDRRVSGRRTTHAESMSPGLDAIRGFLEQNRHGFVKVAPASPLPASWIGNAEQEWIGHSRQCQQQLWRFGQFALHPGKRSATVLFRSRPDERFHLVERPFEPIRRIAKVGEFLIEPHAAILAARLGDQFACDAGLDGFPSRVAYYSSDQPHHHVASSCYRVVASLPFDLRAVRTWLRDHQSSVAQIKKRGVSLDLARIMKRLAATDGRPLTLLVFPCAEQISAILAEMCVHAEGTQEKK